MADEFTPEIIDRIDERAPYVLGATGDHYGVWDLDAVDEPLALFPGDDAGLDRAEAFFWDVVHEERHRRGVWTPIVRVILFVSLGVWIVTGMVADTVNLFATFNSSDFGGAPLLHFLQVTATISSIAFRLWIAALVVLVALWLRRNGRVVEQRLTGRPVAGDSIDEEE